MNERIKELAEQAGLDFFEDDSNLTVWDCNFTTETDVEKFAELVIKECANIAYEVGLHRQTKHEILRRFGLEVTDED